MEPLAGVQSQCSLGEVLEAVGSRLQNQFGNLVARSSGDSVENRPRALLGFVHGARQQLLRSAATLFDVRKLGPLPKLNQEDSVLKISQTHAQALQTVADELWRANAELKWERVPLFNIPDALDVLSTGTYSNLPASIHDMRGPRSLPEAQQQRLVNQLNHLLYSQLLKAHLPDCLELVQVTGGYAVLSCKGLYEVQLTLFQQPYPSQVAEAQQEAAAVVAAATQQAKEQQQQQEGQPPGTQASTVAAAEAKQQDGSSSSKPASSLQQPAEVQVRWQWMVTHAVLLPNAAVKSPLRQVQLEQLLRALRERMWYAADAAAVAAAKRGWATAGGEADQAAPATSERAASKQPSGGSAQQGAAQPSASGITGGSTASGMSSMSAAAAADAGRGLQLDVYAADEVTVPLRVMHGVLRDVAAQILLHEIRLAAEKLAGPGSKWEGQLRLARAEVLTPGIRLHYWQQVPVLLAPQPWAAAAAGSGSTGAAATAAAAAGTAEATLPAVELGLGSDGTVHVMHMPPLRLPGALQQVPLVLDTHTVDIEGLLLQAVSVTASTQLQWLRKAVGQLLRSRGLQQFVQLELCTFGQAAKAAEAAAAAAELAATQGDDANTSDALANTSSGATVGAGSSGAAAGSAAAAAAVAMPDVLVMVLDGNALVTVSLQPWSGRVVLRPGAAYGGELNMDMGILLHQHQEALQQKQEAARQLLAHRKGPQADQQAALTAIQDIAAGLTELCGELWMKVQLSSFLAAARMLALHHTHHHFKGLAQAPQLMYLPSAAAAMASSGPAGAGAVAAAAADSSAAGTGEIASRVRAIRSTSMHTMSLAMPHLQLPPYMLLLAAGPWCGRAAGFSSSWTVPAAAGATRRSDQPSGIAALAPTLCMSFPRRRVVGESRDCLLLVLCDAQGLVGPVLKRIRLPVSCYTSVAPVPGAAADAAAAGQRKRKRVDDPGAGVVAAAAASTPQDEQQQQPQGQPEQQQQPQGQPEQQQQQGQPEQQQRQQQVRMRGWLLQPEEHVAELGAAVKWCQARLTFERLLLEVAALQLQVLEVQPIQAMLLQQPAGEAAGAGAGAGPQQQQDRQQPALQLLGVPDVQLFQQLRRKQGCTPSMVGIQEVWFTVGPGYGQWRMHVRGSFYHQQLPAAEPAQVAAPAAANGNSSSRQQQEGPAAAAVYEYDLRAGHSVRDAMLQLLQLLHMQHFLNQLESMAWGEQCLQVVAVGKDLWQLAQHAAGMTAAPAPANGSNFEAVEERSAKRPKQQHNTELQSAGNGFEAVAAAGSGMMNGVKDCQQQLNGDSSSQPTSNGKLADEVTDGDSSSSSQHGLLFHWQGTGLVRLVRYSCCTALLECGAPLQPAAVKETADSSQQQQLAQRLLFALQWQPRFVFTTQASSGSGGSTGGGSSSSSLTTTRIDVRLRSIGRDDAATAAAGGGGLFNSWPLAKAATSTDVLSMSCSIACNTAFVPADVLSELCDMVNSGGVDLLLDALAVIAWPLAGVSAALAAAAAAAPAAGRLARKAVSSGIVSQAFNHVRYSIHLGLLRPQQQLPAAARGSVADALVLEVLFFSLGRVKVLINHGSAETDATSQQDSKQAAVAAGTAVRPVARKADAVAIAGFLNHMARRHKSVGLLPVLSSGRFLQQLPTPDVSLTELVVGFLVHAHHLGLVLQELLQFWQQHAVGKQRPPQLAVPVAVKVESGSTPVQQQQQLQLHPAQQQQHQQAPGQQTTWAPQQQQHHTGMQQATLHQPGQAAITGAAPGLLQQQQAVLLQHHMPAKADHHTPVKTEMMQAPQQQQLLQGNHVLQPHTGPVASAGL